MKWIYWVRFILNSVLKADIITTITRLEDGNLLVASDDFDSEAGTVED